MAVGKETPPFATGLIVAAAVGMLLLGWTAQGRAEPLRNAPNSRVAMELPESFKPNDGEGFLEFFLYRDSISTLPPMDRIFTFIDVEIPCAIFVLEYAAEHYEKLKLDIKNTEALARAGIAEIKAKKLPDRSGEYVYITGNSEDGDVEIFNMVMHEHNLTVSIFVEIQKKSIDNNSFILTQIEHALSSASVKASHLSDEDFRLDYLGPFKRMGRAPGKDIGIFYGMSEDPFNRPFFSVTCPVDKRRIPNASAAVAEMRGDLDNFYVNGTRVISISGVNGYEILSEWKINGNEYYHAYNVLLTVEGDLYCKLSGIAAAIDAPTYLPEFRKIALSFTRQAP